MATTYGTDGNDRINGTSGNDDIRGLHGSDSISTDNGNDRAFGEDLFSGRQYPGVRIGDSTYPSYQFRYVNNSTDTLHIYAINPDGRALYQFSVEPGQSRTEQVTWDASRVYGNIDGNRFYGVAHLAKDPDVDPNTGPANKTFTATAFNDTLTGGANVDKLYGQLGDDVITGQAGNDYLDGATGDDSIDAGVGADTVNAGDGDDTVFGGSGDDVLSGGNDDDKIEAGTGDDVVDGGGGDDSLEGGDGDEFMLGGEGNDEIYGGDDDDFVSGGMDDDDIYGGEGKDFMAGGLDNDTMYGGDDEDVLDGGDENDELFGGEGDDLLKGGIGDDNLVGGAGDDELVGGTGVDVFDGGDGEDTIYGDFITEGDSYVVEDAEDVWRGSLDQASLEFTTHTFANGDTYVIGCYRAVDGRMQILKLNNDGSLTRTDFLYTEVDGQSKSTDADYSQGGEVGHVYTGSGGDVTDDVTSSDVTFDLFGNALVQSNVVEIEDTAYIFLTSRNAAGVSVWELSEQGEIDYVAGKQFTSIQDQDAGGIFNESDVYVASDGDVYVYSPRYQSDTITTLKFDPDSKQLDEIPSAEISTNNSILGSPSTADVYDVNGQGYAVISAGNGFSIYKIDDSDGSLSLNQTITHGLREGSSDAYFMQAADGTPLLAYSNSASEGVLIYKIEANGSINASDNPSDYILGYSDFRSGSASYYTDPDLGEVPVIILNDLEADVTRVFSIDSEGKATLQETFENFSSGTWGAPLMATSPDGTHYVVDGAGSLGLDDLEGTATAKVEITKIPPAGGDDILVAGAGNDVIQAGQGNDELTGGEGVDTLFGDAGNDTFTDVEAGETVFGEDDRDLFTFTGGTGDAATEINGGTGSTAAGDVDDYDTVRFGEGLTVVPGTYKATKDQDDDTYASYTGSIQVTDGTNVYTINFAEIEDIICFVRGTMIKTPNGDVPIETLVAGDEIVTRDNGWQPIRWIGRRTLCRAELEYNPKLRPIRISKGALAMGYPAQDLYVSPQHRVVLRSQVAKRMIGDQEVLTAAKRLTSVEGVDYAANMDEVEYFHILLDRHEIIYANGAAAETLLLGTEAFKTLGREAMEEVAEILPEAMELEECFDAARTILGTSKCETLIKRHQQNGKPLYV